MRLLYILFLLVLTFNAKSQSDCFGESLFDEFKQQIIQELENRAGEYDRGETLIKHFKAINYSNYFSAIDSMTRNGVKCSDIKSFSLVETYSWHSLLYRTYVIANISKNIHHVSLIDHFKNSITYLGKIERDYFSQMAGYIIPRANRGVGDDYILRVHLFKSGHISFSLAPNSDIFEMNQLFLVEELLFDRN